MALSNTMVTHADWANLLTHGSATQNASPPFVPTVRVQYGGKSVNDMSRVQDPPHSPSKPLSAGGKQRQSSPHDSGPRDSTNHRKSSASHVDDVTQPQESRRGRSQASASGSREIRFSPSTPKRSATQTQAHGNDGGAAGGDREKSSRSRSMHAEHHSPLLESTQADPGQYTQSTIHHCWIRTRLRQNPRVLSRWSKERGSNSKRS